MSGTSKGSILGPVLFTVFINDLEDTLFNACKFFADDRKIYDTNLKSTMIQSYTNKLQVV